jgi:hypothetical protein
MAIEGGWAVFVYVFLILAMEVSWSVVSYGEDEGVGVDRATAEKVIGQVINEVADRFNVKKIIKITVSALW